ncbi:MAG: MCE family protein [Alistipes sp.]|nr:MCE family protein [Alistipes sp.]
MNISREFKIGIFAIAVLLITWWGIKWLGGQNLLHRRGVYYAYYDGVAGLQESSRVSLRGVDVGNVRAIELGRDSVKVVLSIENEYVKFIPENSVAQIFSTGPLGGVEIAILQGDAEEHIAPRDVLRSSVKVDVLTELTNMGTELMDGVTQTINGINRLIAENTQQLTSFVANLECTSKSINALVAMSAEKIDGSMEDIRKFTTTLADSTDNIERIIANFDALAADVTEKEIVAELNATLELLSATLVALNEGDGTAAKLLSDKALYESLTEAGENLGMLLEDLRCNPTRYVHFSLFGGHADKR